MSMSEQTMTPKQEVHFVLLEEIPATICNEHHDVLSYPIPISTTSQCWCQESLIEALAVDIRPQKGTATDQGRMLDFDNRDPVLAD